MTKKMNGKRISISPSPEIYEYLQKLSEIGIHGKSPTEVCMSLVSNEVERLIKEGFLELKK